MRSARGLIALVMTASCCGWSRAQDAAAPVLPATAFLQRTEEPPRIDGVLDDAAWQRATVIDDFRQVEPVEGAEPSEQTEVRLLYDSRTLYIGVRCFDSDPAGIITTQMVRDVDLGTDDHVSIIVGPFFDRRNGYQFQMNAAGSKVDALLENNRLIRRSWDGVWQGKASIDETGWSIEMAIPTQTIAFNPHADRWGFNVERFLRRRNEVIRWASPEQNRNLISLPDAGVLEGISDLHQNLGLEFRPYVSGTWDRIAGAAGDAALTADAGFDLSALLTPSLTATLTVNTDFAETEVDERQVNLTRFPLFFPEKRDFFLQDAGIFNFGGIFRNPLPFFSRRIGLAPSGEVIDILAGGKLSGRIGPWNIGLLDVQTSATTTVGAQNLLVARASLNVLDESTVGGILTHGDPTGAGQNILAGFDFNYRNSQFGDGKTIDGHAWFLQSDSTGADDGQRAWGLKLAYPNDLLFWTAGFTHIDEDFNPALGFVPRRGIREYFGQWRLRWRPGGAIRTIDAGVFGRLITDRDNRTESGEVRLELLEIGFESGDELSLEYELEHEVLTDPFEISTGVSIPPGDYRFDRYEIRLESSEGRPVGAAASFAGGEFYTGQRFETTVGIEWRASANLFMSLEYEQNDVDLPEGRFTTRLGQARVNVYFTPDVSWTTLIQYDNVSDGLGVNTRLRWIVQPGNELFVVLNQAYGVDSDFHFDPRQTELTSKLGWTIRF